MKTSFNKGNTYKQLRPLTLEESVSLHNRINIKQELLDSGVKQETDRGRIPNSNIRANISLHWTIILMPFYREVRELRWLGSNC